MVSPPVSPVVDLLPDVLPDSLHVAPASASSQPGERWSSVQLSELAWARVVPVLRVELAAAVGVVPAHAALAAAAALVAPASVPLASPVVAVVAMRLPSLLAAVVSPVPPVEQAASEPGEQVASWARLAVEHGSVAAPLVGQESLPQSVCLEVPALLPPAPPAFLY